VPWSDGLQHADHARRASRDRMRGRGFQSAPRSLLRFVPQITSFADLFQAQTGQKLAFLHADIAWRSPGWQSAVSQMKAAARARGIRFGWQLRYYGDAALNGWTTSAENMFAAFIAAHGHQTPHARVARRVKCRGVIPKSETRKFQ
jgi:hypothetical protein